jgi:hypothetical protein
MKKTQQILFSLTFCILSLGFWIQARADISSKMSELETKAELNNPIEVHIGVQIEQISDVDQKAENFSAVATLRMEWKDPKLAFDKKNYGRFFKTFTLNDFLAFADKNALYAAKFTIYNQQGRRHSQYSRVIIFSDGSALYIERFTVTLQAPDFNFVQYPFDTQTFYIHIDSIYPKNLANFRPLKSFSKLGDRLGEEEWVFIDNWTEITTNKGITGLPADRFSFGFKGKRHQNYYVMRIFMPLLIFVSVAWVTFFLQDFSKRIDIAGANLLIFVAFNFAISQDLPRLGYMTFLDFILFAMFMVTGLVIVYNVILKRLENRGKELTARRIDNYALIWVYPVLHILILMIALYYFQYIPSFLGD